MSDVISAAELEALRAAPVLLDVRWTVAGGADRDGYRARHLPGARYVDLPTQLSGTPGGAGRHPLPDPADLQADWRRLGLDEDSAVVVYDAGDGSGAVRAWWLLRWSGLQDVRILDGGLASWSGPTSSGDEPDPAPGTITVRPGGMPTVGIDAAANLADEPWSVLLDARAAPRFRGETEPLDTKAGHIPGAVNLPFDQLYSGGRLKSAAQLRALFAAAGMDGSRPAAASCGSGITAGHLVLAGRAAGLDLALFPGSWSQWCASGRPVATGQA